MKTIILSKALAVEYQRYDLDRIKSKIKHYQSCKLSGRNIPQRIRQAAKDSAVEIDMSICRKTIFWAVIIISGFVSTALGFVLIVLYHLPSIISEYCEKNYTQYKSMGSYYDDLLEEMK